MTSNDERQSLIQSVNSSNAYYESNRDYRTNSELIEPRLTLRTNKHLRILPGVMILILVLIERIAYYSLTGNLYLFLQEQKFHWLYYNAISALLLFTGISYLSSLFGGWLSDACIGRFKTIGFAFIIFTGAYWFLTCLTFVPRFCPSAPWSNLTHLTIADTIDVPLFSESCSAAVMSILIFAAIGTGVVKANVAPFGAEQVS